MDGEAAKDGRGAEGAAGTRRRGRPVGSIKLTPEMEEIIISYIEGGSADYVAAEAAGLEDRTFRNYIRRGLDEHPTQSCTPRLARFAKRVVQAKARSRAAREIEAAEHHVPFWLTHMARSLPGRPGWTTPVEDPGQQEGTAPLYVPTVEEAAETLRVLLEAGVLSMPGSDPNATPEGGTDG